MSLKSFHVVFISASLGLFAFMAYWAAQQSQAGAPAPVMGAVSLAGLCAGAAYLVWFLRKSKEL